MGRNKPIISPLRCSHSYELRGNEENLEKPTLKAIWENFRRPVIPHTILRSEHLSKEDGLHCLIVYLLITNPKYKMLQPGHLSFKWAISVTFLPQSYSNSKKLNLIIKSVYKYNKRSKTLQGKSPNKNHFAIAKKCLRNLSQIKIQKMPLVTRFSLASKYHLGECGQVKFFGGIITAMIILPTSPIRLCNPSE